MRGRAGVSADFADGSITLCCLEQRETEVPDHDQWLGPGELSHLRSLRIPKRRADWRLGRWTAKRALVYYLGLPDVLSSLVGLEIRPSPSGAPEAFWQGRPAPVALSLSHCEGMGFCTLASPGADLGCDLEAIEPRSDFFIADYFTDEEQLALAQTQETAGRNVLANLIWSTKESVLKALHEGLRLDTRSVQVACDLHVGRLAQAGTWHPLRAQHNGQDFHGWWLSKDDLVRSVIARPAPLSPISLKGGIAKSPVAANCEPATKK